MAFVKSKSNTRHMGSYYATGEVLGLFNSPQDRRRAIDAASREIVAARMAYAIRASHPEAVAIAIMQAHNRGRRFN